MAALTEEEQREERWKWLKSRLYCLPPKRVEAKKQEEEEEEKETEPVLAAEGPEPQPTMINRGLSSATKTYEHTCIFDLQKILARNLQRGGLVGVISGEVDGWLPIGRGARTGGKEEAPTGARWEGR